MGGTNQTDAGFTLGRPQLVCRWRLSGGFLPLENRHLRALSARTLGEGRPSKALLAWARQHIEWTLAGGSAAHPDGVLMLIVDEEGRAAMSVGPYEELADKRLVALCARADLSCREAGMTGVAPETLWVVKDGTLMQEAAPNQVPSGATSLISDLATTLGMKAVHVEGLLEGVQNRSLIFDEAFLVSDEFGVVPAKDFEGREGQNFARAYERLLFRVGRRRGPRQRQGT